MVAKALGFRQADSGALYRAVTASRIRISGESAPWTEASVMDAARSVAVMPAVGVFDVHIDGETADAELRSEAVTKHVSVVARMPVVRTWVNTRMRECARTGPIVVDGRDMGTAVFPEAVVKVWLIAAPAERARRRSVEMLGRDPSPEELARETIELQARDLKDSHQTKPAPDAVHIDTTDLTQAEQVEKIVALARERMRAP